VKVLAIMLALVPAAASVLVACFLWILWSFPWENREPHTTSDRVYFAFLFAASAWRWCWRSPPPA
jgi:hypothetical protein